MEKNNTSVLQGNPVAMRKTIGKTTYLVRVHFNEDAKENMKDKIHRMLTNDVSCLLENGILCKEVK